MVNILKMPTAICAIIAALIIPNVAFATSTDFPSDAGDGDVAVDAAGTWADAHDATTGTVMDTDDSGNFVLSSKIGSDYYVRRAQFPFDTSTLPDDAIIDSVSVTFYSMSSGCSDIDGYNVVFLNNTTNMSFSTTLISANFNDFGTTSIGSFDLTTYCNVGAYVTNTLTDDTIVDVAGYSLLGVRLSGDIANASPTGNNTFRVYSSEAGEGLWPYLTVVWHTPSSSSSSTSSFSSSSSSIIPPVFTGSLLLLHSACSSFTFYGSGASVCDEWETSMETDFVAAMRVEAGAIAYSTVILMLKWMFLGYLLLKSTIGLFKIMTQHRGLAAIISRIRKRR